MRLPKEVSVSKLLRIGNCPGLIFGFASTLLAGWLDWVGARQASRAVQYCNLAASTSRHHRQLIQETSAQTEK